MEVIKKKPLISDDKKFLNDLLENLIFEWIISTAGKKSYQKYLPLRLPSKKKQKKQTKI